MVIRKSACRCARRSYARESSTRMTPGARLERGSGRFYRRFILPDSIDSDQIRAVGDNGVLEVSIPKQAKAQPRRIQVAA